MRCLSLLAGCRLRLEDFNDPQASGILKDKRKYCRGYERREGTCV